MSDLTQDQKRILIAEACGWRKEASPFTRHEYTCSNLGGVVWWHPEVSGCSLMPPDYFGSLDAMHEAEKVLTGGFAQGDRWLAYVKELHRATCGKGEGAAADVKAEAFGKTLGLWV